MLLLCFRDLNIGVKQYKFNVPSGGGGIIGGAVGGNIVVVVVDVVVIAETKMKTTHM